MDLKTDDLLEKVSPACCPKKMECGLTNQQKDNQASLDLEYVQLNVGKVSESSNQVRWAC